MAERTYKYGYKGSRKTLAELDAIWTWNMVHPEIRRRHISLFNASQDAGHDVGIGGGARDAAAQEAEFYRRHTEVPCPGQHTYKGKCYNLKPGMAPFAPPGSSNHETGVYEGYALAIDLVGWEDHWADANVERFYLKNFGGAVGPNVNGEEWHTQPVEFRNSRSDVNKDIANGIRLGTPRLPGDVVAPTPPPPVSTSSGDDMIRIDLNPNTPYWVSMVIAATTLTHTVDGYHAAVLAKAQIPQVVVDERDMEGILRSLKTTNASPFAPGMPSFNQHLHDMWVAAQ